MKDIILCVQSYSREDNVFNSACGVYVYDYVYLSLFFIVSVIICRSVFIGKVLE